MAKVSSAASERNPSGLNWFKIAEVSSTFYSPVTHADGIQRPDSVAPPGPLIPSIRMPESGLFVFPVIFQLVNISSVKRSSRCTVPIAQVVLNSTSAARRYVLQTKIIENGPDIVADKGYRRWFSEPFNCQDSRHLSRKRPWNLCQQ
jgi:hypothetical protein